MSAKPQTSPRTLAEINKQIIEIKKKIQLSEGQRKAAFEAYETERKINADQILKLKKDIKELVINLKKNKDESAAYRVHNLKLETIVGPLANKTVEQVKDALDLQIIDKRKHLDLLKHRKKQREQYLGKLAKEYQTLLLQKPNHEVISNIRNLFKKDNTTDKKPAKKKKQKKDKKEIEIEIAPQYKKKYYTLQNNIHRIEVQWREAEHVRNSYKSIRSNLLKDRSYFESTLKKLEEKRENQLKDIQELQRMNAEAASTRSAARSALDREERSIVISGRIRERQAAEQQVLFTERHAELEKLERQIYQSAKLIGGPQHQTGVSGGTTELERNDIEEDTDRTGEDVTPPEEDKETPIKEAFEKLKDVTGATNTNEVLEKFQAQRETKSRLEYLKKTTEAEKRQLELKQNALTAELERYRYAQERDNEKYSDNITALKNEIVVHEELIIEYEEKSKDKQELLITLCNNLYFLYLSFKEVGIKPLKEITSDPEKSKILIETLQKDLENINLRNVDNQSEEEVQGSDEKKEIEQEEEKELSANEDELLPNSYNMLFRRTPIPVQGHVQISVSPGIEDEEEVPSRSFLKRQAQLVVDAKSRRKALRIPMNRK